MSMLYASCALVLSKSWHDLISYNFSERDLVNNLSSALERVVCVVLVDEFYFQVAAI